MLKRTRKSLLVMTLVVLYIYSISKYNSLAKLECVLPGKNAADADGHEFICIACSVLAHKIVIINGEKDMRTTASYEFS